MSQPIDGICNDKQICRNPTDVHGHLPSSGPGTKLQEDPLPLGSREDRAYIQKTDFGITTTVTASAATAAVRCFWRCWVLLAPFWLSAGTSVNAVSCFKIRLSLGPACGGLVTMAHLQQALSSHCCYWQLLLLGSKTADAGGAGELPLFALKAMPLALRFHRAGLLGILGDTLPGPLLPHVPSSGVADRSVCERERHCSEWSKVSLRPALALASLLDKRLRTQASRKHPCAMVLVPSVGRWSLVVAVALPRVLATQVFRFQDSRHLLPMHLVSSRCSSAKQAAIPSFTWWKPFHRPSFRKKPLAMPTRTVDPSIGAKYLPCSGMQRARTAA